MLAADEASLVRVKGYPSLLTSRVVGSISVWFDFTLMFSALTFHWQADAQAVGFALALYGLPGLAIGPYLGALADRSQPAQALALGYAARIVVSIGLASSSSIHIFIFLIFLKGLANVAMMPVEQVLIQRLLKKEQLVRNAGVMTLIDQFSKIGAPMLAAGFATWSNPTAGFFLSALLATVGLVAAVFLGRSFHFVSPGSSRESMWHGLAVFRDLFRHNAQFRTTYLVALSQSAVLGFYDPLLALFLKGQGFAAGTFGVIVSCTAAGAIGAGIVFRRIFSLGAAGLSPASLAGFGMTVLLPGLFALTHWPLPLYGLYVSWLANGFFYGIASMLFMVTLQREAPSQAIGAVVSLSRSTQLAMLVAGPILGSWGARHVGIPTVFVLSGAVAIASGLLLYALLRGRPSQPAAT